MALSAKYVGSFGGLYFCDYTIPYHHIDLAACTLPKVLVAVTVIALYVSHFSPFPSLSPCPEIDFGSGDSTVFAYWVY